ncbi:hypothetical protein AXX16_3861 [Serratia rubidaea]|nr:hypothetical protein AXX16_3861 [Serratia rubidaea]
MPFIGCLMIPAPAGINFWFFAACDAQQGNDCRRHSAEAEQG